MKIYAVYVLYHYGVFEWQDLVDLVRIPEKYIAMKIYAVYVLYHYGVFEWQDLVD